VPKNWKPTYDRIKVKIDSARNELPKDNKEIEEFVKDRPGKSHPIMDKKKKKIVVFRQHLALFY